MPSGIIKTKTDRGFGFIAREGQPKDIFFHYKELSGVHFEELREGDTVNFDIVANPNGFGAVNVRRNGVPDEEEIRDKNDSDPDSVMRVAVQTFSSQLANGIARDPKVLERLEWRDLERLIAELFDGLGFDVELMEGSKDGGKDVIVGFVESSGERKSYYVQIKHWRSGKRVKSESVTEFIHVIARDNKTGGIVLATHGFAKNTIETVSEIQILKKKVGLGTDQKVVGLCRHYVRASEGIWYPPAHLDNVIFEDTILL